MSRMCVLLAVLALRPSLAPADLYWITYEGNDFPENEGWERHVYGGGAERYLQDGCLVLDGRGSTAIADFYRQPLISDPGEGEAFEALWSVYVADLTGFADPGVALGSHGHGSVVLRYQEDRICSLLEGVYIDFTGGVAHDYLLTSNDMLTYSLFIDGALAHVGIFIGPMGQSQADWGDYTQGASSLSTWNYFRFGVVPEPATGLAVGSVGLVAVIRRTRTPKEERR
jgi:hypothetical protein